MGKDKKRKHSRSRSKQREKENGKTEAKLQKMQTQLDNLTNLLNQFVNQREEKEKDKEDDSNKENEVMNKIEMPINLNDKNDLQSSSHTENEMENETDKPKESEINEEILQILGDDPNANKADTIKLHTEVKNRWKNWMKEGLSDEIKKSLTKKYPRKGELYSEPPKINLEISAALTEISKKRDQHFVENQECVGTAIISLGAAVSLLLEDPEEGVDQMKLMEYLCDTGKLLSEFFYQQSKARKSFITPVMKKSVKPLVESLHSDEWLYGQNLAVQIKEAKTIESACQSLKAQDKKFQGHQGQGNWKGPSTRYRQTGSYPKKQFVRFKQRPQYRSSQMNREKNRSTKDAAKK